MRSFALRKKNKMKERLLNLLKGKFLVSDESPKNWRFILFLAVLAVVLIASSHRADRMAFRVAILNDDIKKLKGEYASIRTELQKMKFESNVVAKVKSGGVKPSENPPKKIRVLKD